MQVADMINSTITGPLSSEKAGQMPHWLTQRAHLTPERTAVKTKTLEWTFAELHTRSLRTAGRLLDAGVLKGSRVALMLASDPYAVQVIHALSYARIISVPLNTRLSTAELIHVLQDAQVTHLIYDRLFAARVAEMSPDCASVQMLDLSAFVGDSHADSHTDSSSMKASTTGTGTEVHRDVCQHVLLADVMNMLYTSGTTGQPKGVQLSYGNHWWSAVGSALNLGVSADDCWLACLPFYHVGGFSILMRSVIYGMPVFIQPSFQVEEVYAAIVHEQVTHISVVSTMLQMMLEHLQESKSRYPHTLKCVLLGGGPVPELLLEQCHHLNVPVYQTYGLTETASQVTTLAPEYMYSKAGSAGKPLFPVEIKIEKEGQVQPPATAGEIVVRGPNVTSGYYRQPLKTEATIRTGWLYTGDYGYVDTDGFLYVLDRRSDLFISGGENVYPAEIESVLNAHPAVREAGVIGLAHEKWGHVPVAFIVCAHENTDGWQDNRKASVDAGAAASAIENATEGATASAKEHVKASANESGELSGALRNELLEHCRAKLAAYKVPVHLYKVQSLPRNATGKLLRRQLQTWLLADADAQH